MLSTSALVSLGHSLAFQCLQTHSVANTQLLAGVIGGEVNEAITAKFAAILATLGVSKERFYIKA